MTIKIAEMTEYRKFIGLWYAFALGAFVAWKQGLIAVGNIPLSVAYCLYTLFLKIYQ